MTDKEELLDGLREHITPPFMDADPKTTPLNKLEKRDNDYISYWRLKKLIEAIPNQEDKTYLLLHYGLAGRLREIIGDHTTGALGIRWADISIDQKGYLWADLETEKNKTQTSRTVFIPNYENWLIDPIKRQRETTQRNQIIKFSPRTAERRAHKWLDHNEKTVRTHALRHSRASHLRQIYNYPIDLLARFLGHSDLRQIQKYTHLSPQDLIKPLEG